MWKCCLVTVFAALLSMGSPYALSDPWTDSGVVIDTITPNISEPLCSLPVFFDTSVAFSSDDTLLSATGVSTIEEAGQNFGEVMCWRVADWQRVPTIPINNFFKAVDDPNWVVVPARACWVPGTKNVLVYDRRRINDATHDTRRNTLSMWNADGWVRKQTITLNTSYQMIQDRVEANALVALKSIGADDSTVRIYNVLSGALEYAIKLRPPENSGLGPPSETRAAFSSDGDILCISSGNVLYNYEAMDGKLLGLSTFPDAIDDIAFQPNAERLVIAGYGGTLWVVDGRTLKQIIGPLTHEFFTSPCFAQDGRWFAAALRSPKYAAVAIFDAATLRVVETLGPLPGSAGQVAVSRNGKFVALQSSTHNTMDGYRIIVWSTTDKSGRGPSDILGR